VSDSGRAAYLLARSKASVATHRGGILIRPRDFESGPTSLSRAAKFRDCLPREGGDRQVTSITDVRWQQSAMLTNFAGAACPPFCPARFGQKSSCIHVAWISWDASKPPGTEWERWQQGGFVFAFGQTVTAITAAQAVRIHDGANGQSDRHINGSLK